MVETRSATADDWPSLWPLVQAMGTHHPQDAVHARYRQSLRDPLWAVIGAFDGGRLVGYASLQDYGPHLRTGDDHRIARLHDLWVDPAHRRCGVGSQLVDAATRWASARVRYLEWQAHERRSAPFYERLGYHGNPCPQPDYPTFVIDFNDPASASTP